LDMTSTPRVLGLSGGSTPARPLPEELREARLIADPQFGHDAAAVLVCGGDVVAGVEEERLNRLKHSNRLASRASQACLDAAQLTMADVDRIAIYGSERRQDGLVKNHMLAHPDVVPLWTAREYFTNALSHDLNCEIDPSLLVFVEHHLAHAASAYHIGPFPEALVVTLDGEGDSLSGSVWVGAGGKLLRLRDISRRHSLGYLYLKTIALLGYGLFDEYKVMGLAPYGNPQRFRQVFEGICHLQPNGQYEIDWDQFQVLAELRPRRPGEPFTEIHRDLAAALQEAIERTVLHLLEHFRKETGLRRVCLAGGVAHNSTMIGKVTRSGLFEGVFVQPASHDAGCALGAALTACRQLAPTGETTSMAHVYWGTDIGDDALVKSQLDRWASMVDVRRLKHLADDTAALLADGAVIGWVQGRSEFGPRALGNRSILADPRPVENKDRINDLVKQRESYRPFAPAVLEEDADEFFDMPANACCAFMTLTVPVRPQIGDLLGAVTHVDGTARVQTVSRTTNERFWSLIAAFQSRTGIPVLLNTSFNHSVEPIVESVDDAMSCFLTTGLTHLVVGDCLVTKRALNGQRVLELVPSLPDFVRIVHARQVSRSNELEDVFRCDHTVRPSKGRNVSLRVYRVMQSADGRRSIRELLDGVGDSENVSGLGAEFEQLWADRLIRLLPA
jgi:carbamoyltransferase